MKKNKRHLGFYNTFMRDGKLPCNGLCGCADAAYVDNVLLLLLSPTDEDMEDLRLEGKYTGYWGSDYYINPGLITTSEYAGLATDFTPLRQNVVLFMAAINNEL